MIIQVEPKIHGSGLENETHNAGTTSFSGWSFVKAGEAEKTNEYTAHSSNKTPFMCVITKNEREYQVPVHDSSVNLLCRRLADLGFVGPDDIVETSDGIMLSYDAEHDWNLSEGPVHVTIERKPWLEKSSTSAGDIAGESSEEIEWVFSQKSLSNWGMYWGCKLCFRCLNNDNDLRPAPNVNLELFETPERHAAG